MEPSQLCHGGDGVAIAEAVADLIEQKLVTQSRIIAAIRQAVIERSAKLPPVEVMYNSIHGGFGLLDAFIEFVREGCGIKADEEPRKSARVRLLKWMAPFGAECGRKYPAVRRAVRQLAQHDLSKHFGDVATVHKAPKYRKVLESHVACIESMTDQEFGRGVAPLDEWYPYGSDPCKSAFTYTKDSILAAIAQCAERVDKEREQALSNLREHFSDAVIERLVAAQEQYLSKNAMMDRDMMDFSEAVQSLGEADPGIWRRQRRFHQATMFYLCAHPNDLPVDENINVDKSLGMLFAASAYCFLSIKQVPALSEWKIHEYDGKETVELL
jgi:hypothetical protein